MGMEIIRFLEQQTLGYEEVVLERNFETQQMLQPSLLPSP
ncbi:Uncharacterised protein [Enterobacter bugandensis]|uniref:Uncharacterized protein n=1 Tax=Enterobacter bugandensis TaxID=881260 RepID=A0A822WXQ2_9ENTR|nr:Uncharacterised protein [Enterobacter bugandensis]